MGEVPKYPKRLIEVDLPIREISKHARREKSIRHGHLSTLHLWWARRPLAACRAVICAALWPDPVDELCPSSFRVAAVKEFVDFAKKVQINRTLGELVAPHWKRWRSLEPARLMADDAAARLELRSTMLDFVADFANWDASAQPEFLAVAQRLTSASHPGNERPLVFDPFAGGGAIPLEALRVGARSFATDLNPIPVLLNRVLLEYVPRFGADLAKDVRTWGRRVYEKGHHELGGYYGKDVAAYLFARTARCEGPSCGITVPLLRSSIIAKRARRSICLDPQVSKSGITFSVREGRVAEAGTVRKGSVECPACGYTTPVAAVRKQLAKRSGGTKDAQLIAVVVSGKNAQGRTYRAPEPTDLRDIKRAEKHLSELLSDQHDALSPVPNEEIPIDEPRRINVHQYGIRRWGELFTDRQALSLACTSKFIAGFAGEFPKDRKTAILTCLSLALGRLVDANSAQATWSSSGEFVRTTFGRQALPFVWDFAEANPWGESGGNWLGAVEWIAKVIEEVSRAGLQEGHAAMASAMNHPLPDDSADAMITDPPYYYSVPYSHLSDFFYVWHRRLIGQFDTELFPDPLTPKAAECVQSLPHSEVAHLQKSREFYEDAMRRSLAEGRRVAKPDGIGTVVFAHTETEAWEALLGALLSAGWCVTASWPIDTERANRTLAMRQRTLASSIHLVCRPRENVDGSLRTDDVGSWRDVLAELPIRLHEWMPRLAKEGIVGADAIFACLGPALEIFSRYSQVEKASGDVVTLREYLEQVWSAVAREALSMMFEGADAGGLEEDARLTAMWLWTLGTGGSGAAGQADLPEDPEEAHDPEAQEPGRQGVSEFALEFDAARKIAQGLGARIDTLPHVLAIEGDTARLLRLDERAKYLFHRPDGVESGTKVASKKQMNLFVDAEQTATAQAWGDGAAPTAGVTTLDRVHQAMLLFGSGRGETLKRFLVEEGVGLQAQFWRLAQSLSVLYPAGTDEKRWVDGVLGRKKSLGFG